MFCVALDPFYSGLEHGQYTYELDLCPEPSGMGKAESLSPELSV